MLCGMRFGLVVGLCSGALVLACGCEDPQVGSPGLEPPRPRDPDVTDAGAQPTTPEPMVGGGRGGSGTPTSGGAAGSTVPPNMEQPDAGDFGNRDAASSEPDADAGAPREDNPLFLGLWVVEQPSHALYEATLYELLPSGELVEHDTYLLGAAPYQGYVTGTVANADSSVRCDFHSRWTSAGARQLELGSECTDAQSRAVQLSFPDGDPATGLVPTVDSVGGESGWAHRYFRWTWRMGPDLNDCMPFLI
jgi:hypothetical protein